MPVSCEDTLSREVVQGRNLRGVRLAIFSPACSKKAAKEQGRRPRSGAAADQLRPPLFQRRILPIIRSTSPATAGAASITDNVTTGAGAHGGVQTVPRRQPVRGGARREPAVPEPERIEADVRGVL